MIADTGLPACAGLKKSEGTFECSARLEPDRFGCLDLDLLAGLGIDAGAGGALGHGERAESDELDLSVFLQGCGDRAEYVAQGIAAFLIADFFGADFLGADFLAMQAS